MIRRLRTLSFWDQTAIRVAAELVGLGSSQRAFARHPQARTPGLDQPVPPDHIAKISAEVADALERERHIRREMRKARRAADAELVAAVDRGHTPHPYEPDENGLCKACGCLRAMSAHDQAPEAP